MKTLIVILLLLFASCSSTQKINRSFNQAQISEEQKTKSGEQVFLYVVGKIAITTILIYVITIHDNEKKK